MIFSKLKRGYQTKVFPKVENIRGSTRLMSLLKDLAEKEAKKIDSKKAESIFERDEWKNLVILDACRYDIYNELYGAEPRISLGAFSPEFIERNFSRGDYSDIVYINSNPHLRESQFKELTDRDRSKVFHTVFDVYENKWDEELGTVRPEDVYDTVLTANKLFPEKRKIIHFMQPHTPYIDFETEHFGFAHGKESKRSAKSIWTLARQEELSLEELEKAYKNNLEIVKSYADKIGNQLEGKTVITADHGEFLGENGLFGHRFENSKAKKLRCVPWDVKTED